jgi:VIT1/CCC1 family predicted Fe2+/Mn2+ transporter
MSWNQRLDEARQAYESKDKDAAAKAHSPDMIMRAAKEEHGSTSNQYIGSIVYGGLDGVVTTFAAISGVAGANLTPSILLIVGLANLLADGFSMAVGAYLSHKSESEYYDREEAREKWEMENFPEGEKAELDAIYQKQGFSVEEAKQMTEIVTKDKKRWLQTMMQDELGLTKSDINPVRSSLTTFAAFALAGLLPLIVFIIGVFTPIAFNTSFYIAAGISALTLFGLGAAKVKVTGLNPVRSGLEMLLVGGGAAAVAYLVGLLLKGLGAG